MGTGRDVSHETRTTGLNVFPDHYPGCFATCAVPARFSDHGCALSHQMRRDGNAGEYCEGEGQLYRSVPEGAVEERGTRREGEEAGLSEAIPPALPLLHIENDVVRGMPHAILDGNSAQRQERWIVAIQFRAGSNIWPIRNGDLATEFFLGRKENSRAQG